MDLAELQLPFTATQHVSKGKDTDGKKCTVVLRNTTTLPAEITFDGQYKADGKAVVMVIPGDHAKTLKEALRTEPAATDGVMTRRSRIERIKTLLKMKNDALATAVAAFLKKNRPPPGAVVGCLKILKKLAFRVLVPSVVALLFYFSFIKGLTPDQVTNLGIAIDTAGPVLACLSVLLQSKMSRACAATCALLLVVALIANPILYPNSGGPGGGLDLTYLLQYFKTVIFTGSSALTVAMLLAVGV